MLPIIIGIPALVGAIFAAIGVPLVYYMKLDRQFAPSAQLPSQEERYKAWYNLY